MKFCSGDDFGEFLHVCRLDVDNVEALILNVEVPQVYSKIIATDEGLAVAVDGDTVNVICMCVCIRPPRHGSDDGIVVGEAWQSQGRSASKGDVWIRPWRAAAQSARCQVVREVILCDNL